MRINERIRVSPIRLIGPDGEQLGIIPTNEALQRAADSGLDLVEVAPNGTPPVCRILDYGKLKYEISKKDKAAKKRSHSFALKEMRFRPKIDEHDYQFKAKHVREFLESGSKVRVFVMFRGREMAYTELGQRVLDRVIEDMKDIATIDSEPKMEGRNMSMVLSPTAEVMQALKKQSKKKTDGKKTVDQTERAAHGAEHDIDDSEDYEDEIDVDMDVDMDVEYEEDNE